MLIKEHGQGGRAKRREGVKLAAVNQTPPFHRGQLPKVSAPEGP